MLRVPLFYWCLHDCHDYHLHQCYQLAWIIPVISLTACIILSILFVFVIAHIIIIIAIVIVIELLIWNKRRG